MEAVTSSLKGHAVAACKASKLCGFAAYLHPCLSAVSLVTAIAAIFFTIAEISPWHALIPSAAPESVRGALGTILLVRVIRTFPSSVAPS